MTTGRILHLLSMFAPTSESRLVIPVSDSYELSSLSGHGKEHGCYYNIPGNMCRCPLNVESHSSKIVECAEAMGLTTCGPKIVTVRECLSDVCGVRIFWISIIRRGVPLPFGTLLLCLTISVH